jgi:hypothetical protein
MDGWMYKLKLHSKKKITGYGPRVALMINIIET